MAGRDPELGASGPGGGDVDRDTPPAQQLAQFELLWLEFRKDLSLSRAAGLRVLEQVGCGKLPCDAWLLRRRVEGLLEAARELPQLRVRDLLSGHVATLAHEPAHVARCAARLSALLPDADLTTLMTAAAGHLHRDLDDLALQYLELNKVFRDVFDMDIPPTVFDAVAAGPPGLRERLRVHVATMCARYGREVSYVALSRTPALLDVPPDLLAARLAFMQRSLALDSMQTLRLLERHGAVLLVCERLLRSRLAALPRTLGWRAGRVRGLLRRCPAALALTAVQAATRWRRATALVTRRATWAEEWQRRPNSIAVLLFREPLVDLRRMQYLASSRLWPRLPLWRLLLEAPDAFAERCPAFRRWWAVGALPPLPLAMASTYEALQRIRPPRRAPPE